MPAPITEFLEVSALAPSRHCAWLLRPLVDLGPFEAGPFYSRGIEYHWQALTTPEVPRFGLQRMLPHGFRATMLREADRADLIVDDPRNLPESVQTERWRALCTMLDAWGDLPVETRCRLVLLLHALCFYEFVVSLVPKSTRRPGELSPEAVELAYWRESALYMLRMPQRFDEYRTADLSGFDAIAADAPHAVYAAFNASVKTFVHLSKVGAESEELARRAELMQHRLADVAARLDPFTAGLLTSRFHRALAFLPMRRGDRAEVTRHMDLAELHARALRPTSAPQRLLYLENLHPVMESRSKEALWLGDQELALARARIVTELDCYDPKSWLELGELLMSLERWHEAAEAFVVATMLGPPVGAIGRYMAGVCFRRLGQEMLAAFFFQGALEVDPLGISPRVQIAKQPNAEVLESLKEWSSRKLEARV